MGQGGSSGTAFKVSLSLPFLAQDPQLAALLPEGAAERTVGLLQAAGLLDAASVSSVGRTWRWRVAGFVDRHLVPGQLLYLGLRKRFVDDEVRAALAAGATQVLVVGAGYDTLALRLAAAHPEVLFVEVDRPATLGKKRDGALALGLTPSNLQWLAVDLESTLLDDALGDVEDWDGARQSIVVAEGLLMYLTPPAVLGFLDAVRRNAGAGTRPLFTYLRPDAKGRPYMGKIGALLRGSLRLSGESLRWSVRDEDLPELLKRHGYRIDLSPERCNLRRRYLEPAGLGARPLGSIERLAVADLTSSSSLAKGDPGPEAQ